MRATKFEPAFVCGISGASTGIGTVAYFRGTQPTILTPHSLIPSLDQPDGMPTAEFSGKKPDVDVCLECLGSCGTWKIGKDDIGRFQKCPTCNGAGKRTRMPSDS